MAAKQFHPYRSLSLAIRITFVLLSVSFAGNASGQSLDGGGAVYVLTNQAGANSIVIFDRDDDGNLNRVGEVPTGGLGTGHGLGAQGALTLSSDGHLLFAVNAGSNTVSVLRVTEDGLRLVNRADSGGILPISVTAHGGLVYVLNAGGGSPNITGFSLTPIGKLIALPNSTRPLAGGASAAPAQVAFSPDGELLLVTEKGAGLIDVFTVESDGRPGKHTTQTSNNATPFGFGFQGSRVVVVSEAAGGRAGASTASSYRIDDDAGATLATISAAVPDTQTAACWIVVTRDRQLAFATNTGSGTVSSFDVSPAGALSLREAVAADLGAGSTPIDMALSRTSSSLFVLSPGIGAVAAFQVQSWGLVRSGSGAVPLSSSGIAAR
jgi:6-phosphogluconolactonase (cycloisomerase 2 family)